MQRASFLFALCLGLGGALLPIPADAQSRCAAKSVAASAIRTLEDVRAFVECAADYVAEHGTEEAYRAFHEDERWHHGQFYVYVNRFPEENGETLTLLHAASPSREGRRFGSLIDRYGNDFFGEETRLGRHFGGGWIYYSFTNPADNLDEPKAAYLEVIDWDGAPAVIGAGIHLRDLPGSCVPADVHAAGVAAEPSPELLQEFVRCAAYVVEDQGYFAMTELGSGPRWRDGSVYLFGLDLSGNQFFTGNPIRVNGVGMPEWGDVRNPMGPFGGRDVVSVAGAFGETFLYYEAFNPASGRSQRKVGFVKRVMAQGTPVLIGSGYYLPDETPTQ